MDNIEYTNDGPNPQEFADGLNELSEWDAEPRDPDKVETVDNIMADLARLSRIAYKLGVYIINPPRGIAEAATNYYNDNADSIRERFAKGGARPDTVEAVLSDFGRALFGMNPPTATTEQMLDALAAVNPVMAFNADRYVLFLGVMRLYSATLDFVGEYQTGVKENPAPSQRQKWFEAKKDEAPTLEAVAYQWAQQNGYVVVSDFAGVQQPAIRRFLNTMEQKTDVGNYLRYYAVAKFALRATAEQLAAIEPPRNFDAKRAEEVLAELNREYDKMADQLANIVSKSASGETPPTEIAREAREAKNAIERVQVPENIALILSRGMWAAADGQQANSIMPISAFIDEYVKRHAVEVGVTPLILQKAVEGVNLLQQIKKERPANGVYTLRTNISEFSDLCGYADANEEQKQQLLTALRVLHNLYIIVWKPTGRVAVQLFGVQQIGLSGKERGNLVLNVFASGLKGRPNLVSAAELSAMKKKEKGAAMLHFRGQILSKGHKVETTLMDEIFGYTDRIREAELTGDPQQVTAVRDYIRKHRSRDKKKLLQWFDDWAARGIISYEITTAKNGETLYRWRRLMAPTDEEKEQLKPKIEPNRPE